MGGPESPGEHAMTEELLTSRCDMLQCYNITCPHNNLFRFGSHESVCKPYTVRTVVHSGRGREGAGPGPGGGGKLDQIRRSVTKVLGEFSVREHVFYGAIFLSMTIIVMFCFLLVNRTQSNTSSFLPYQGNLGKTFMDHLNLHVSFSFHPQTTPVQFWWIHTMEKFIKQVHITANALVLVIFPTFQAGITVTAPSTPVTLATSLWAMRSASARRLAFGQGPSPTARSEVS